MTDGDPDNPVAPLTPEHPEAVRKRLDCLEMLLDRLVADIAVEIGGQKGERIVAKFAERKRLLAELYES